MSVVDEETFLLSDFALARRLERAEGEACARFVEARARVFPESKAEWVEVAGTYVIFDTVSSPVTQTFGLGLFHKVGSSEMDKIEEFFHKRGAPVVHEVSPLADTGVLALLKERSYQPVEFSSVMYRPIHIDPSVTAACDEKIFVRLLGKGEEELWAKICARGWDGSAELADFLREASQINAQRTGAFSFLAELAGVPIATGVLSIQGDISLLAGACTVPEGRKQGAQLALLKERLRVAAEQGCNLAMMCAPPGSASQRNAERHGFRIAYTRIKWELAPPAR
jgi:hypothetical protein